MPFTGSMAALWFEDRSETPVWHEAVAREDGGTYRMACGLQPRLAEVRRLWPQKEGEAGPARDERCPACASARPMGVP